MHIYLFVCVPLHDVCVSALSVSWYWSLGHVQMLYSKRTLASPAPIGWCCRWEVGGREMLNLPVCV